ncbi:MAG: hypothetical protein AAGU19_22205 [Prolixibacteraceae bacterium]
MKKILIPITAVWIIAGFFDANAQDTVSVFPGADEQTPSRSEYFTWINNTNEGATENQTLINLQFFKWLQEEYGMQLDIYAFDAGAIDGSGFYGSIDSERFNRQFPHGFDPIAETAKPLNLSLGLWGGPDGFGNTPQEEQKRTSMMVSLVRDYNFSLFKMDGVCGQLRTEKQETFYRMMNECRKYRPDLILLNHRLNLGKGMAHSTTFLLGSAETYIDVHMSNGITAPHHRAGAISRELTPKLTRLTEDHGVCLSSCLDYWEDDLILQAFNRNLVVSPQIYGNPWLLRDDEFPRLARLFNLHRKYRDILPDGIVLPEENYGPKAVSRGDSATRFITLRNLGWDPVTYTIALDQSTGLTQKGQVLVKLEHPFEQVQGSYAFGSQVKIEVLPFRSCLLKLTTAPDEERSVAGCNYEVVKEVAGKPMEIQLLGFPGESCKISLRGNFSAYSSASLGNTKAQALLKGKTMNVRFPGQPLAEPYHRKLGDLTACPVPGDARGLYEATCFAADNNALEVRSLYRSGPTGIPRVQAARDAFFNQKIFIERDLWDKYLFDDDPKTFFSVCTRYPDMIKGGALRIDLGKTISLDSLVIRVPDEYALSPLKSEEGVTVLVSNDFKTWEPITFLAGKEMTIPFQQPDSVRYLCIPRSPSHISEMIGYRDNLKTDRGRWRVSNLFQDYGWNGFTAENAWSCRFTLNEIPKGSYLCIAINGPHGAEQAFASVKIDGQLFGCPDRSPSFQSNVWEYPVAAADRAYTYYLPLTSEMTGKTIEAFVLSEGKETNLKPEVWISAYPIPFEKINLVFYPEKK